MGRVFLHVSNHAVAASTEISWRAKASRSHESIQNLGSEDDAGGSSEPDYDLYLVGLGGIKAPRLQMH